MKIGKENAKRRGRESTVGHVQIDSLCSHLSASLSVGFGAEPIAMTDGSQRRERNRVDSLRGDRTVRGTCFCLCYFVRSNVPDHGLGEAFRIDSHANCLKRDVCICCGGMSRVDVGPLCLGGRKVGVTLRELDALIHY